jgi:hypothetical protein
MSAVQASSAAHRPHLMASPTPALIGCFLTEESVVCPTGGGFENTEWSIRINDGWFTLPHLAQRRRVGQVAAEIEDEDDPHRAVSSVHWDDRPPQVWYRRTTYVTAPVGTHFRKRIWTPERGGPKGIWFRLFEDEFELRGENRLISVRVLNERRARQQAPLVQRHEPLPREGTLRRLKALLAGLQGGPCDRT